MFTYILSRSRKKEVYLLPMNGHTMHFYLDLIFYFLLLFYFILFFYFIKMHHKFPFCQKKKKKACQKSFKLAMSLNAHTAWHNAGTINISFSLSLSLSREQFFIFIFYN